MPSTLLFSRLCFYRKKVIRTNQYLNISESPEQITVQLAGRWYQHKIGGCPRGGVGVPENSDGVGVPETKRTTLAKLVGQRGAADFLLLAGQLNNRRRSPNDLTSIAFGMFYGMSTRKIA